MQSCKTAANHVHPFRTEHPVQTQSAITAKHVWRMKRLSESSPGRRRSAEPGWFCCLAWLTHRQLLRLTMLLRNTAGTAAPRAALKRTAACGSDLCLRTPERHLVPVVIPCLGGFGCFRRLSKPWVDHWQLLLLVLTHASVFPPCSSPTPKRKQIILTTHGLESASYHL